MANWLLSSLNESITDEIVTIANGKFLLEKSGHGWTVTGNAKHVAWARYAEKLLVVGETIGGNVLAVLPLAKAKIKHSKNMAGEARDEVIFEQVLIEDCKTIPVDDKDIEKKILYAGALTRTVLMAGALDRILELTINHTNERAQFGRPIHRFQAIQHHLALLAGETAAAGMAVNYAVDAYGKDPFSKEIAFAKIRVNEAVRAANPIAHQVLAAIGFTYEHTLHHSTRRLWSWRDEFGTETDWEHVVTDELLKLEKNGLWSLITGVENHSKKVGIN
jgi:acyl-CoA dehydrogenase